MGQAEKMRLCLPFVLLLLCACSSGIDPYFYVRRDAGPQAFEICHGYGCTYRTSVGVGEAAWKQVQELFQKAPKDSEEERARIAQAIALMEVFSSQSSGLPKDAAEASSRPEDAGQMDCIDETVNTTQYLTFLEADGLLKFHSVGKPIHRGYFVDGKWPHNAATIVENNTGTSWVVDSFYEESGTHIHIVPPEIWLKNWSPRREEG